MPTITFVEVAISEPDVDMAPSMVTVLPPVSNIFPVVAVVAPRVRMLPMLIVNELVPNVMVCPLEVNVLVVLNCRL